MKGAGSVSPAMVWSDQASIVEAQEALDYAGSAVSLAFDLDRSLIECARQEDELSRAADRVHIANGTMTVGCRSAQVDKVRLSRHRDLQGGDPRRYAKLGEDIDHLCQTRVQLLHRAALVAAGADGADTVSMPGAIGFMVIDGAALLGAIENKLMEIEGALLMKSVAMQDALTEAREKMRFRPPIENEQYAKT